MTFMLHELQALVSARYGVSVLEIDPDCPLQELGIDAVGLEELIVTIEDNYKVVMFMSVDENYSIAAPAKNVKVQTLRQLAGWVDQLRCDRSSI